ncbi:MAG TPA: ABC transporter permease [Candidatus Limnocylindria bacterium]|nr:ABC transporter permease [Candidatus Limnocylindria bacterium]
MRLLRNLSRRKLRTSLTILGITIGIWALVVFSSMANKINALVEGGSDYYADKLIASDASAGGNFSTTPMSIQTADEIAAIDGVEAALPQISMFFSDEPMGASMGMPDTIVAGQPEGDVGLEDFEIHYAQGRALTDADEGSFVAVVGSDLSRKFDVGAGDTLEIRGHDFEVVGVLEPTLTAPDTSVMMPMAAGQQLFAESLPDVMQTSVDTADLATQVVVYPEAGVDTEELSDRIEAELTNVSAMTGAEFDEVVGSSIAIFNAIIIGVAAISLVVGGLSVINTMAMSVQERTREIGIKRAIGGQRGRVVRELVAEAGMIGLLGGLIGLALGALVVVLANEAGRSSGTVLFDLTPGTAIFALAFSTILGMLAGIIPAWSAARLDPVQALRYE